MYKAAFKWRLDKLVKRYDKLFTSSRSASGLRQLPCQPKATIQFLPSTPREASFIEFGKDSPDIGVRVIKVVLDHFLNLRSLTFQILHYPLCKRFAYKWAVND